MIDYIMIGVILLLVSFSIFMLIVDPEEDKKVDPNRD